MRAEPDGVPERVADLADPPFGVVDLVGGQGDVGCAPATSVRTPAPDIVRSTEPRNVSNVACAASMAPLSRWVATSSTRARTLT